MDQTDETAAETFVPSLDRMITEMDLHLSTLHAFQCLGYDFPSQDQKDAITSFVKGNDVFIVLPTGSGKSLCYVTLPFVFEKFLRPADKVTFPIVVVITPLTSLMKDQVKKYGSRGVRCAFVGDECNNAEREKAVMGEYNLVYASPESLLTNDCWRSMFHNDCYQSNQPSKALQAEVHATLLQYRDAVCTVQGSGDIPLLFGKEISGIPDSIITHISKNCTSMCNKSDFERLSIDHALDIFEIVKEICDKHTML